jgi:putative nucleotidyltransferase-like protein
MTDRPDRIESELWEGVNRLIDRSPSLADLRAHRLQLLALARWRELGRPIPPDLDTEALQAAMAALAAPVVLERIRAAIDGPALLLKGPEVAACYPNPTLRPFGDLDLLVPDAEAVQAALVDAGFVPLGEESHYVGIHHLRPLCLPDVPLVVEIHSRPKWIEGLRPPSIEELLEAAVDSAVGVPGIQALPRAHHALVLAAHAWGHTPLETLFGVVDVAVVRQGVSASELEALASRWGLARVWRLTSASIDALFLGGRRPWPLRIWARHLAEARERTVLETHLQRLLADFSALPFGPAVVAAGRAFAKEVRPSPQEDWPRKLKRMRLAFVHASLERSKHEAELDVLGRQNNFDSTAGR